MENLLVEVIPALSDNYIYLLKDQKTKQACVIDPGEAEPVMQLLAAQELQLNCIVNTHHHGDHVGGNLALKEQYGCRILGPQAERQRIPGIDIGLVEGDSYRFLDYEMVAFAVPGHTKGHIALWFASQKLVFSGDCLFALGCGRLFEGSAADMWDSLQKLMRLPDDTYVFFGHEYTLANGRFACHVDPDNEALANRVKEFQSLRSQARPTVPTTIGDEIRTNPFLRVNDASLRKNLGLREAEDAEVFAELRRRKDHF